MCFRKKKKEKINKIKPSGASNFAGSFSIFAGVLAVLFTVSLFIFFFIWGDSFTTAISKMNEGLIVVLIPFLVILFIFWILFKLMFGGVVLSYMIVSIVLFFVCGVMMKTASANLGNIYSNKSNRRKAITCMILWWIIVALQGGGIFLTNTLSTPLSHDPSSFKMLSYINVGVFSFFAVLCFLVTIIDFFKKSKKVQYNEQGQMIDETYASSTIAFGNNQSNITDSSITDENVACGSCGATISPTVQFCPHCGSPNANKKLKVGDITEQGKVIGFDLKTNEPKFMPVDKTDNEK